MHTLLVTADLISGGVADVQRVMDDYEQSLAGLDGLILSIGFHQRSKLGFLHLFRDRAAATAYLERDQLAQFVRDNARILGSPLCQMYEVAEVAVNGLAPHAPDDLQPMLQPKLAEVRMSAELATQSS